MATLESRIQTLLEDHTADEIRQVTDMLSQQTATNGVNGHHADPPIYAPDDVPDDLITLREAADSYHITIGRLRAWKQRGHLREIAQMRGPGSPAALVARHDLESLLAAPPRRTGRPKTNGNVV